MSGGAGTARNYAGKLGPIQLIDLAEQAGFSVSEAPVAAALAIAESGGDPNAVNPTSHATGLWQILPSNFAQSGLNATSAKVPANNAKAAHLIYTQIGWKAWTTYGGASYSKALTSTKAAVNPANTFGAKVPILGAGAVAISTVGDFLQVITSPDLWKRVGLGVLGALMVIAGLVIMVSGDVKNVASNLNLPIVPV